jgi:hypothetical protein
MPRDIRSLRRLNRACAAVGMEYLLPKVRFFVHNDEVERLETVGKHYDLPKQVTCFAFYGNTLPLKPQEFRFWKESLRTDSLWATHSPKSEVEKRAKYNQYLKLIKEQEELVASKRVYTALKYVVALLCKGQLH